MPNRVRKNSVVDMLAKVHVNRGSLLTSIESLLKTIDCSESAVMIPTLLRDKFEFDANELLFVAKILRASILGHTDLVEFYMNHMGQAQAAGSTPASTSNSASASATPPITSLPTPNSGKSTASPSTATTTPTASTTDLAPSKQQAHLSGGRRNGCVSPPALSYSSSPVLARPAPFQEPVMQESGGLTAPLLSTVASSLSSSPSTSSGSAYLTAATSSARCTDSDTAAQAHVAEQEPPVDFLGIQLGAGPLLPAAAPSTQPNGSSDATPLSISTSQQASGLTDGLSCPNTNVLAASAAFAALAANSSELRASRSALCLSRLNAASTSSGASSPRTPAQTPGTPTPILAEPLTLAHNSNGLASKLHDSMSAPVKLLLQIEQLKSSINHVQSLLETVVELYKKSIDNIAMA